MKLLCMMRNIEVNYFNCSAHILGNHLIQEAQKKSVYFKMFYLPLFWNTLCYTRTHTHKNSVLIEYIGQIMVIFEKVST